MKTLAKMLTLVLVAGSASLFVSCSSDSHSVGAAVKPYPLNKCIVSDEALNHEQPYIFVHNGQQIKLCCKDCLADFNKDPEKYLAKLTAKP